MPAVQLGSSAVFAGLRCHGNISAANLGNNAHSAARERFGSAAYSLTGYMLAKEL